MKRTKKRPRIQPILIQKRQWWDRVWVRERVRDRSRDIELKKQSLEKQFRYKHKGGREIKGQPLKSHDLISNLSNCGNEGVNFFWKLLDIFFLISMTDFKEEIWKSGKNGKENRLWKWIYDNSASKTIPSDPNTNAKIPCFP